MTKSEIKEIKRYESEGLITVRPHNTLPLRILNYTSEVQYERLWTPLLKKCRGLIIDNDWNIIGYGVQKFFNWQEHLEFDDLPDIPNEEFQVWEKLDGSCIILFNYKGNWE